MKFRKRTYACTDVPLHVCSTHMRTYAFTYVLLHIHHMHVHKYTYVCARVCACTHATRVYTRARRLTCTIVLLHGRLTPVRTLRHMRLYACTPTRTLHACSRTLLHLGAHAPVHSYTHPYAHTHTHGGARVHASRMCP